MRVHRTQRTDIEKQVVGLCRPHTAHNADTAPAIKSRSASRQPFRPPPADAGHLAQKLIWIPPLAIAGPGTAAVWLAHIGEKFRPARNRLLEPARKRPPVGRSHFPGPQSLARSADHIAVGIFPRRAIWIRGRIAEVIRDLHKPTLAPLTRPLALQPVSRSPATTVPGHCRAPDCPVLPPPPPSRRRNRRPTSPGSCKNQPLPTLARRV